MHKNSLISNTDKHPEIKDICRCKEFRNKEEYVLFVNSIIKEIYQDTEKYNSYLNKSPRDYKRLTTEIEPLKNLFTCPQFLGFAKEAKFSIPMDNNSRDVVVQNDPDLEYIEITQANYDLKTKKDITGEEELGFEDCLSEYRINDSRNKLEYAIANKTKDKYKSKIALLIVADDILLQVPFQNDKKSIYKIWHNTITSKGTPFVRIIILGSSGKFCMDSKYPDAPLF